MLGVKYPKSPPGGLDNARVTPLGDRHLETDVEPLHPLLVYSCLQALEEQFINCPPTPSPR